MRIVVAFTRDEDAPSGGARQLYRHVDVLNELGYDAVIAHPTRGFRMSWFKNETRVVCSEDLELKSGDFLAFGEQVEDVPVLRGSDKAAKVLMVQNPWGMFMGFRQDLARIKDVYGSAAGVMCQSRYTERSARFFFPAANVLPYRYSFDRAPFSYRGDKQKVVAFMPRKNGGAAQAVFSLLRTRRCPDDWQMASIEGADEERVAEIMRLAAVFVSFSDREGFGMPPAEAMACGCAVVGFPGFAGEEYMLPGLCYPARDCDVLDMVEKLDGVLTTDLAELVETGRKASEHVRSEYSTAKEVAGIAEAWGRMSRSSAEVSDGTKERVRSSVAAYVPVYNEGPYLEHLLRWLVKRTGAVFVRESARPWCPGGEPGGRSKAVVDKVLAEMPEAGGVLDYALVEDDDPDDEPLAREAVQRNMAMEQMRKAGFEYVWMVEADEFYADAEADRLWRWIFEREGSARVFRCRWHTYWRSLRWRIEPPEMFRPNVVFRSDCRFERGRKMSQADESAAADVPPGVCVARHYSWARTPEDTRRKLSAWGHARELRPGWFEDVFAKWTPGCGAKGLHPIVPEAYGEAVRCDLPVPEALEGHPFLGVEMIGDEAPKAVREAQRPSGKRIKAVVMSHDQPESVDRLYEALAPAFDDVEVFDSGSAPDKVPVHATRSFPNVYWTGLWEEVFRTCSGYDAVWVLGGDVTLEAPAMAYRESMERALPFGCWSPAVNGRAKPFMRPEQFGGMARRVLNVEGIAMAASGELLRAAGGLPGGSRLGFGQDLWMCMRARELGMSNAIDGGVTVRHPQGTGYDDAEACRQMDEAFSGPMGKGYRRDRFLFSDLPEENFVDWPRKEGDVRKLTVATVDNGWGMADFLRIVGKVEGAVPLVMRKGLLSEEACGGAETVPYDPSLKALTERADAVLFTRVGEANKDEFLRLLKAGVPTVVHNAFGAGLVEHERNGFLYIEEMWATRWLAKMRDEPEARRKVSAEWKTKAETKEEPAAERRPRVTVVTPTYRRDPKVLSRAVGCMLMQTFRDWEQVVCSDGSDEPDARRVVESAGDPRVRYEFTEGKKEGDFGNTVRQTVLGKARGEFVLFLDDDNLILPQYLERMVAALDADEDAGFAVCRVMHFGPLHESEGKAPKVLAGERVELYHVDPLQVLVRTELMRSVGWDVEVGYLSDGVTLEKLGKAARHVRVEEVLGVHV